MMILWSVGQKGGTSQITIPDGFNSMIYVIKGSIKVADYGIVEKQNLIVFEDEGNLSEATIVSENQDEDTEFLILSGAPIGEKVVQQGPFVMNSETEILEAMRDYQMGKMGLLIEE